MDFTKIISSSLGGNNSEKPSSDKPKDSDSPSSAQLFSSAKVVAGAAQSALHEGTEKLDKAKVAGAASDLLDAASHYGKLEGKPAGQYVEKAQDYLHQYSSTAAAKPGSPSPSPPPPSSTDPKPATETGDGAPSEGGSGDFLKIAQGFLQKK